MRFQNLKTRFGVMAVAAVMASCIAVPSAYATAYYDETLDDDDIGAIPTSAATPSNVRPTAAATRAAMPAVEILGLQGVEESGQLITLQLVNNSYYQPVYTWVAPKYMLFTSSYSSQPSAYLVNFAIHSGVNMAVYNESRAGGGQGPNAILANGIDTLGENPTDEEINLVANQTDDMSVWAMNPDIIIGTGGKTDAVLDSYMTGYDHTDYVNYNVNYYPNMIATIGAIRDAVNNSSVTTIANAYIAYINNAADTVIQQDKNNDGVIDDDDAIIVAWVKGYTAPNGITAASFTIGSSYANNGTAAQNRYLETAEWAGAVNLNDNTTSDDMLVSVATLSSADIIVVGGQQGSSDFDTIMGGLYDAQLLGKTYFVTDNNMKAGSAYGVVMNSIENAQNLGRILQPITGISQRDSLAYYFEHFYHINSNNLAHVMSMSLNGYVRNWTKSPNYNLDLPQNIALLTEWNESTDCGYTPAP